MGYLRVPDLLMMLAYAGLMLFVGWWYSREKDSSEDYFVASRNARPWLVGISMIATMLSTVSYVATPGEMIAHGPGMFWTSLHGPISFLVIGFLVIPRIMRYRVTSGYELLETRFGGEIRKAASLLFIFTRLIWMGFIIFTCGTVVAEITRLPLEYVLVAVGVVTTIYTVMGGIRAVIVTDTLQFGILMAGGIMVVVYVTYRFGGFSWWPQWNSAAIADLHWQKIKVFSLSPFERVTAVTALLNASLWWICTAASDQMMIQRYLCTRDARAARRSFMHCLIGDIGIVVTLWMIGFALLGYFLHFKGQAPDPSLSISAQADRLFPHFIATVLPAGLRGLIVAALFAAAMSSLSSGISSVSTVLVIDFPRIFARGIELPASGAANDSGTRGSKALQSEALLPRSADQQLAARAKVLGIGIGLFAIVFSYVIGYVPGNIYSVTFRVNSFFVVPLFVLYALAFFVPFSTPGGAWAAIVVGFLAGVLFSYWKQIVGHFTPTEDFSVLWIMPSSLVLSLAAGILISFFTKPRLDADLSSLTERVPV
jgi:SSS family solute:Na+ symporter